MVEQIDLGIGGADKDYLARSADIGVTVGGPEAVDLA